MRTLKGLAALLALTALVVGIPAALILLVGNPIPSTAELQQAMTGIDFGGTFLMGTVLPLIAWGFWASFVYSLVVEVISLIRRVETPNLGGALRPQQALAGALGERDIRPITGGTDTHLSLHDLRGVGVTGADAEARCDAAGIVLNKNAIPFDPEKPAVTSGVRLGSPAATTRGFGEEEFRQIGRWIVEVVDGLSDSPEGNPEVEASVRARAIALCRRFPIYPEL